MTRTVDKCLCFMPSGSRLAAQNCPDYQERMRSAHVHTDSGKFRQRIQIGGHVLVADEPASNGGDDAGPEPHEFLLAGLGACTSMTVKLYADGKGWPLLAVDVTSGHRDDTRVLNQTHDHAEGEFPTSSAKPAGIANSACTGRSRDHPDRNDTRGDPRPRRSGSRSRPRTAKPAGP